MIEVEVIPRKWGNSLGVTLSKDVVKRANIREDRAVTLLIPENKVDLAKVFGTLKFKEDTQDIIGKIREGEE